MCYVIVLCTVVKFRRFASFMHLGGGLNKNKSLVRVFRPVVPWWIAHFVAVPSFVADARIVAVSPFVANSLSLWIRFRDGFRSCGGFRSCDGFRFRGRFDSCDGYRPLW